MSLQTCRLYLLADGESEGNTNHLDYSLPSQLNSYAMLDATWMEDQKSTSKGWRYSVFFTIIHQMSADFTIPLRNPWHLRWCFASKPPFGLTLDNPKIEVDWFSILRYINQTIGKQLILKLRLVKFACIQEAAPPKSPPTAPTAPLATLVRLMPSSPDSMTMNPLAHWLGSMAGPSYK